MSRSVGLTAAMGQPMRALRVCIYRRTLACCVRTHRGMSVLESADSHPQPRLVHSDVLDGSVLFSAADVVGEHGLRSSTYVCARGENTNAAMSGSHAQRGIDERNAG